MVTPNKRPVTDTQKPETNEHKHAAKENHQTKMEETKRRRKNREELQKQPENKYQMAISTYLSIIILNVNELNAPIKRHRVADWIEKKQDPSIRYLQDTHFRDKDNTN